MVDKGNNSSRFSSFFKGLINMVEDKKPAKEERKGSDGSSAMSKSGKQAGVKVPGLVAFQSQNSRNDGQMRDQRSS